MRSNNCPRTFFLTAAGVVAFGICLWLLTGGVTFAQSAAPSANDASLQAAVSGALLHDPLLKNQPVIASVSGGVVTLTGSVETEQQRQEAETAAANVRGVSGIQDNITVTGASSQDQQDQPAPPPPPPVQPPDNQEAPPPPDVQQQPTPRASRQNPPPPPPDQEPPAQTPQSGYGQPQPQGGGYGYPDQQPVSGPVTIPSGALLQIRLSQPLDMARLQPGSSFEATVASDVFEGNVLAIPRGAVLEGTVVDMKKPGSLSGNGGMQLQITDLSLGGRSYPLATDVWSSEAPSKSGYTARNTVGGAVLGAIIGGLLGRGPGAAAGALVGGGAGMVASAHTNGPRLYLPAESVLNFHLTRAISVQPVSWQEAQQLAQNVPRLQRRPVYMAPPYPYPYGYAYAYPYPYAYYRVYGW